MAEVSRIAVARAILAPAFPGTTVSSKVPSTRPNRFIRLTRIGGVPGWAFDNPSLVVECWSTDGVDAEKMALLAMRTLYDSPGATYAGGFVTYWRPGALVDFKDPDIPQQERWQFTGALGISA